MQHKALETIRLVKCSVPKVRLSIYTTPLDVSNLSLNETAKYLIETQSIGLSQTVTTLNWEMISRAYLSKKYRNDLSESSFFTADGASIVIWMKIVSEKNFPIPERVAGVDLVHRMLELIQNSDKKIGIIGGREHQKTLSGLHFPIKQAPLIWDGPVYEDSQIQLKQFAKLINENNVDFLFLAVPSTKQNWLLPRLKKMCTQTTILGVGGTFDYLGRRKRRAPILLQRMHMEWLWRLTTEQRTAFRYLVIYPIGLMLCAVNLLWKITPLTKKHY